MSVDNIRNHVYMIRGQQVMLDCDLADIYGYEVKALNQQVKRNIARFPEDFMFQLEREEVPETFLKSQFVTLNENVSEDFTLKNCPMLLLSRESICLQLFLEENLRSNRIISFK